MVLKRQFDKFSGGLPMKLLLMREMDNDCLTSAVKINKTGRSMGEGQML